MPQITTSHGKSFPAADGQSLLDAALCAGVTLPYSCRTGRCSTCKAKSPAGSSRPLHDETGLTPDERIAGWILTCVRTATSDLQLEVDDLADVTLPSMRTAPCRIQSLDKLTHDVLRVTLRLPPATEFGFLPGQYIEVIGHGGTRRSYSIANAPAADKRIELHIREVPGGAMSAYWFGQAKVNDLLHLNGPLGTFFLRNHNGEDLVFLATGTGIAPVKAILEGMQSLRVRTRSVSVFWGGRHPEDLYWDPSTCSLPHDFVPVLSRAADTWAGARGHVQQAVLRQGRDWGRTVVYACGSEMMIQDAQRQLVAAGLDNRRFYSDAFVCSAAA